MIRLYLLIFIVGTISAVGYSGYRYVSNLQAETIRLSQANIILEQTAATNQITIDRMKSDAEKNARLQQDLNKRLQEAQAVVGTLRTRLSQIDITREALTDPVDMELRVNRGVDRLIQRIYEETGGEVVTDTDTSNTTE
jgi:light-regulated signal transduction histidine kinase (bacteriophytochrome)